MTKKKPLTAKAGEDQLRPPVVAVLGHVDHGKTTLLDKIRQTNVVVSEAGGITQHIGAYRVKVQSAGWRTKTPKLQAITFIDTPGHAAFSQMRSRGAKVADLVVLVVAANEGVKPQTIESLNHIQEAGIPYLVALTKIDLTDTNVEMAKKNLAENGVLVEGYGGEIVVVPVSGKTGQGIDELLEMILLLAEMTGLKGSPSNPFGGVVIESKLDHRRGTLATVIVRDGKLKVGEEIKIDSQTVKVKALFDDRGKRITEAGPSQPVEILGLKEMPPVGARARLADKEITQRKTAESVKGEIEEEKKPEGTEKDQKVLKVICKADTRGTLEAISQSLPKEAEVILSDVGDVSTSDVLLAQDTGAEIVAFNVKVPAPVKKLAAAEKIKIRHYKIIYELLEEIERRVLKILEPTIEEEVLGRAKILQEFEIKNEKIAGCQVVEGKVKKPDQFHLKRGEKIIGDCRIKSMKTGKENIEKAQKGEEFGAILVPLLDFQVGDVLVSFRKVEEP